MYIASASGSLFTTASTAVAGARKAGVDIVPAKGDAAMALASHFDSVLSSAAMGDVAGRPAKDIVAKAQQANDKWGRLADELGFTDEDHWVDFDTWLAANPVDTAPFIDAVVAEVIAPHRPA